MQAIQQENKHRVPLALEKTKDTTLDALYRITLIHMVAHVPILLYSVPITENVMQFSTVIGRFAYCLCLGLSHTKWHRLHMHNIRPLNQWTSSSHIDLRKILIGPTTLHHTYAVHFVCDSPYCPTFLYVPWTLAMIYNRCSKS